MNEIMHIFISKIKETSFCRVVRKKVKHFFTSLISIKCYRIQRREITRIIYANFDSRLLFSEAFGHVPRARLRVSWNSD